MRLIDYLENKISKFQKGGSIDDLGFLSKFKTSKKVLSDNELNDRNVLTDVKRFYLQHPSRQELVSFLNVFKIINKDPLGFFKLFRIKEVLPISSANGVIMVIETKSKKEIVDNQLLIKIPQTAYSDSVTYEYYIGQVLNELRIDKLTDNFALVYGLISCGFNKTITEHLKVISDIKNQMDNPNRKGLLAIENKKLKEYVDKNSDLCVPGPSLPHIIYEYIRNIKTNKTETLNDYILKLNDPKLSTSDKKEIELNIIYLTMMIMYSLQVAHDQFDFTHYDLHTNNILVIELPKPEPVNITYKGKSFTIMTNVIPHIIDYGRAHVNPKSVDEITGKSGYYDVQLENLGKKSKFPNFKSYQDELYKTINFSSSNGIDEINNKMFGIFDEILRDGSELYFSTTLNKFLIVKLNAKIGKYINDDVNTYIVNKDTGGEFVLYNNKRVYIVKYDYKNVDRNRFVKWISDNIYNKDLQYIKDLVILKDKKLFLNRYDMGIHPNKPNKKYDMFRLCKIIHETLSYISGFELEYYHIWDNLDTQLDIEYPFQTPDSVLPSDYHLTDILVVSSEYKNDFLQKYIKEPKDISEYFLAFDSITKHLGKIEKIKDEQVFQIKSD